VLGLLGGVSFGALLTWAVCILVVMLASGWLASRLIPGKRIPLMTELPPLRWPVLGNVLKKTGGRLKWYLVEVIPLFLIGTFLMFALDKIGALPAIIEAGEPLVSGWLGLPKEASAAFVMGFLRRDFGATGLFAMTEHLSAIQAVVGMVTITLFVPCIASVMMIVKEQGLKVAVVLLDPDHSHRLPHRRHPQPPAETVRMSPATHEALRLTGIPEGTRANLAHFDADIPAVLAEQLHAYGLVPPHAIQVLRQQPLTVVLCEQVELALEHEIAHRIWVEATPA